MRFFKLLYFFLLVAGCLLGIFYVSLAVETWSKYLDPPNYNGFGPFLLNSIDHVIIYSTRAISALMLFASALVFFRKERASFILALGAAVLSIPFFLFEAISLIRAAGDDWLLFYMSSSMGLIDFALVLLTAITSFWMLLTYPKESSLKNSSDA